MKKRIFSSVLAVSLITATLALPILNPGSADQDNSGTSENVSKAPTAIVNQPQKPDNSPSKEPIVKNDEKVTFIVEINGNSLLDTVIASNGTYSSVSELVMTDNGKACCDTIKKNQAVVKASIQKLLPDSDFSDSRVYYAVFNGFSVKAPLSTQEKIQKINGVKSVTVSDMILHTEDIDENAVPATRSTVSQSVKSLLNANTAYDGSGLLIAVIDSEFNTMHEVFSAEPAVKKYDREQIRTLYSAVEFSTDKQYSDENVYKNGKIVYAYDYAENDDNTNSPETACHGTHVASLTAGNNGKENENAFQGIACNAQLALMKVCEKSGYASTDTVLSALDDCAKLGADVINISLGNDRQTALSDIFREPLAKLENIGTIMICPAGNSGYHHNAETLSTSDIDYSALNFLAYNSNVLSAASSTNPRVTANYLTADGNTFLYSEILSDDTAMNFTDSISATAEYVFLEPDEDGNFDYSPAEDKIAVIPYREDFEAQSEQAYFAHAKAIAFVDGGHFENHTYTNPVTVQKELLPIIFLDDDGTGYFEYATEGTIEIGDTAILIDSEKGNVLSDDSSWGVTPDLKLKPEITSVGENVQGADSDGNYRYMTGTSVSSALVSGAYAVIKQYLSDYDWFHALSQAEQTKTVIAVLMSNAEPVKEYTDDDILYISPRKQGAGRVDIASAMESEAYLEVHESDKPKADLGDSMTGEYDFSFTVRNISSMPQTFSLHYYLQTDTPEIQDGKLINTLEPYSLREHSSVTFEQDGEEIETLTVDAGGEAEIHTVIKLDEVYALMMMHYFPNGFYVDGYIVPENQDGKTLNLPFMGFCGKWENISPFDYTVYDNAESVTGYENTLIAQDYQTTPEPVVLGVRNNEESIFISKNTVGSYYDISQLKNSYILPDFYLLRDAYDFTVSVSDTDGKHLFAYNYGTISASRDTALYTKLLTNSQKLAEFFSNLSDGDYLYTVSAKTMKADGTLSNQVYSIEYPFCVDSKKPESVSSKTYQQDGTVYLALTAKDNRQLRGFELYTSAYNSKTHQYEYADKLSDLTNSGYLSENACVLKEIKDNGNGSFTYIYDITELHNELAKLQFITKGSVAPCSAVRIAYKAFDGAYNATAIKTADAVAYQRVIFTFTDQNEIPAEGITVALGERTAVSDKNGQAVFDSLLPDIYLVKITDMPESYTTDKEYFLVTLSSSESEYHEEILVQFHGDYPDISETPMESSAEEPSVYGQSDSDISEKAEDKSIYAILFVGILLLVSTVSLIVSKQRRKQ